jgi:hypothetical protein
MIARRPPRPKRHRRGSMLPSMISLIEALTSIVPARVLCISRSRWTVACSKPL